VSDNWNRWITLLDPFHHGNGHPADIIVTQHAAFGHASSTTGVNEVATLTWLLTQGFINDNGVLNLVTKLHKISPKVNPAVLVILGQCLFTPDNEGLNTGQLSNIEAREHFVGLNTNDLSL